MLELAQKILDYCPFLENAEKPFIVAGGFVRAYYADEKPSDLDIFTLQKEDCASLEETLRPFGTLINDTKFAKTFMRAEGNERKLVQVISAFSGTLEEIINGFDFTVCKAGILFSLEGEKDWRFEMYSHPDFMVDLARKRLIYHTSEYPMAALKRTYKYMAKGYKLCDQSLTRIAQDIIRKNDTDINGGLYPLVID